MRWHGVRRRHWQRGAPVYLTVLLCWTVAEPLASDRYASDRYAAVRIDDLEIVEVYDTSYFGPLARGHRAGQAGDMWMREGDRLADGKVAWIGFLSHRLAVVRLKQRVWPPDGREPYRQILRVLGWDLAIDADTAVPEALAPFLSATLLRAVGREGLGSWPQGLYLNPRELLVEPADGQRLPRVDLFAAFFREKYGSLPWQHEAWDGKGWVVAEGLPLYVSMVDLFDEPTSFQEFAATDTPPEPGAYRYHPGSQRDPFRSLLAPWALRKRPSRPAGIHGLLIDDVELEEVYETPAGPRAKVRCRDAFRSCILRPGDQLRDGEVVSISPESSDWYSRCGEVAFQRTHDELAAKPFQRVVKRLPWRRGGCY